MEKGVFAVLFSCVATVVLCQFLQFEKSLGKSLLLRCVFHVCVKRWLKIKRLVHHEG